MLALERRFDTFFVDNLVTGRDFASQIDLETLNKILARELIMGSPREDFVFKLSVHLALLWIDLELSAEESNCCPPGFTNSWRRHQLQRVFV